MAAKITEAELDEMFRQTSGHDEMPDDWTPVGGWLWVSGDTQDERNQVGEINSYCIVRRYWPVRWYVVHAKSAFKGKHEKDLERALADTREGFIKVLIIAHSNRIQRQEGNKGTALLELLGEFEDAHGHVESVEEPELGGENFGGLINTYVTGLNNAEKSKTIRREVRRSWDTIDRNGGVKNKVPARWYVIEGPKYDRHPVPKDLTCEIWPRVLQACIAGQSAATIAASLDRMGIKPSRAEGWHENTIRRLIRNPIFCGRRLGWVDTPLLVDEAVVPVDTWQAANEALTNREKRGPGKPRINHEKSMLARLKCLRCGSPMYRGMYRKNSGITYLYYRCTGHGPGRKGCGNWVPLELTDTIIVTRIFTTSNNPYRTKQWVPGENWDSEIADRQIQISELAKSRPAGWLARAAELEEEIARYEEKNRTARKGGWQYIDTGMTEGQHFISLDIEGQREYLKTHDIRVEKVGKDMIRVVIDGVEHGTFRFNPSKEVREMLQG